MQVLNVAMEYLTQQHALRDMGELALVGRCPKSIVIGDHDEGADQHQEDKGGQ